jgi:transposase
MPTGRPLVPIILTDVEKVELERIAASSTEKRSRTERARIILASADSRLTNEMIANELKIARATVGKWRARFGEHRMEGLSDAPRSGAPRKISTLTVEEVVNKTLTTKPFARTHWSSRIMAKELKMGRDSVQRIWRAFGLKPHLVKSFKISNDPQFIEKVRDITGLYLSRPVNAIVLCVDEKSQCQALSRTQPILPLRPGLPERATHDYERHGTMSLFTAFNVASGKVLGQCYKRHRQQEFLAFLRKIDAETHREPGQTIHIVMDNYATHKTAAVVSWFAAHPEYQVHFTPTSSSWMNQVERFFAKITNEAIRRGSFKSARELQTAIETYIAMHNANDPKPFIWTATAESILAKIEHTITR